MTDTERKEFLELYYNADSEVKNLVEKILVGALRRPEYRDLLSHIEQEAPDLYPVLQ